MERQGGTVIPPLIQEQLTAAEKGQFSLKLALAKLTMLPPVEDCITKILLYLSSKN